MVVQEGECAKYMKNISKYNNEITEIQGRKFASKKEANRYKDLLLLEKAGVIKDLECQVPYELQPSYKQDNKTIRAIKYVADFVYKEKIKSDVCEMWKEVIEDTKGYRTEIYKIKKKMFEYKYGVKIREL